MSWCAATARLSPSTCTLSRWRSPRPCCGWTQSTAIPAKVNNFQPTPCSNRLGEMTAFTVQVGAPRSKCRVPYAGRAGRLQTLGRCWCSCTRDLKAGEVIFREGDPAHELFIIQSGEIEIRLGNRVLETLPQYSIFGEMALIDSSPRSATAVAVTDTKLVSVSEKQFLFLVSNTPYFALNVMRIMARRLRAANR